MGYENRGIKLSKEEQTARRAFYVGIFGEKRLKAESVFTSYLWPTEAYQEKITGLTARGFKDPQKMITSLPTILGYSFDNIDAKIAGLTARGFKDPQKMITSFPSTLGLSFDNIDEKITGLTARGFKDPQKMITASPPILSYSFDNIDEKITGLTARGFKDPQKIITSLPTILGLSFVNIDRKLRLSRRLGIDIYKFIAYSVVFMAMSPKNYVPIARRLRETNKEPTPKNVSAVYKAKTFKKP